MRTIPAAVAVVALLMASGCDRPAAPPAAAPPPAPPPAPTSVPTPAPVNPPEAPSPPAPAVVSLVDAAGAQTAMLSCGTGGLQIFVPGFRPIGSEDRLSIGAGGEAFALVADLAGTGRGVTAAGAPDPDLLDRLERGEALFAMYGRQSAGPLTAASPGGLRDVISACRRNE